MSDNEHSDDDFHQDEEDQVNDMSTMKPPSKSMAFACFKKFLFALIACGLIALFIF